ncbi:MAG TPA: hypothetical protein PLF01_03260 [Alphaproteobacteria bacterium]|nr:hypothetical protein [Alphaproteobacteria bacterium]
MGKRTENNKASGSNGFKKPKAFRMAYSLNNHQPVECTLISDQPFFYMDEEMIIEEDSILSDESFCDFTDENYEFLESEITLLKNKMDAYERVSSEFKRDIDGPLLTFIDDAKQLCAVASKADPSETLQKIKQTLMQSRMAATLMGFAQEHGVEIICSDQISTAAYDKKAQKILVRSNMNFADQILLTVQELRRHWQHRQGALVHPLTFHPDQAVLINRAQLADLSAAVIRCAWEMKLQGLNDIWARIEHSSLSDLGRALAREALSDFRTLNNGKASAAVFETWFLSERCRQQDKKLIQAMLADYRGYVFDSSEASKMVSIDLICALGEQPFGKNYLAAYAQMIMNDPVFTDIRDRSNANFLWFIKFERSFTETEQELQSSLSPSKSGVDRTITNNDIIEDTNNENQSGRWSKDRLRADILGNTDKENGDNVIHIQFGAAKKPCEGVLS